jgi:hypothetical protein
MQLSEKARKDALEMALAQRGQVLSKKRKVRASLTNKDLVLCIWLKSIVCACVGISTDNTVLIATVVLCVSGPGHFPPPTPTSSAPRSVCPSGR